MTSKKLLLKLSLAIFLSLSIISLSSSNITGNIIKENIGIGDTLFFGILSFISLLVLTSISLEDIITKRTGHKGTDELRKELEPDVRKAVYRLIDKFSKNSRLKVKGKRPRVLFHVSEGSIRYSPDNSPKSLRKYETFSPMYHIDKNLLVIPYSTIMDSERMHETMGEEIGHYFRQTYQPKSSEKNTQEFFGYLGRRILTSDKGVTPISETIGTKKHVVGVLRKLRERIRGEDEAKSILAEANRRNILEHFRGYDFASKVDLSKIHDFKKLFSMPDREVRMRFFRENPDYSGL